MASTSGSPSTSEKNGLLIQEFCSITGAHRDEAYKKLEVCNWNLGSAINMHIDSDNAEINTSESNNPVNVVGEVRPPIPPTRGILVENDGNFHYGLRNRKRRSHSVFDGFLADARLQELPSDNSKTKKRRTLEDLFRPPLDLMHRGNFNSARYSGQSTNRWLMVNIQNSQEFSCQILNRDVWSNQHIKNLIDKNFVFWQVYNNSVDGRHYMPFYQPIKYPYIAVIDPRTGENLVVWNSFDATTLRTQVDAFLKEFNSPNGTSTDIDSSPSKCSSNGSSTDVDASPSKYSSDGTCTDVDASPSKCSSDSTSTDVDASPSKYSSDGTSTNSDESPWQCSSDGTSTDVDVSPSKYSVSDQSEDDQIGDNKIEEIWEDHLGAECDPKIHLLFRFPDGKTEQISWPCSTKIKALLLYIEAQGYNTEMYELITNYPPRNFCQLDLKKTLKEIDLFQRELLIVQEKF